MINTRPLVLVHGLWDNPCIFKNLIKFVGDESGPLFVPHLPHKYGKIELKALAYLLDQLICERFGRFKEIDLLGFSMGGIIGRIWLQQLGGAKRTSNFISLGSPHYGTLTAHLIPSYFFPGIADMKRNSSLLNELNRDIRQLQMIDCSSFFCFWDAMVFPGWEATLPFGYSFCMPVLTHRQLISHPRAIEILAKRLSNR